MIAPSTSSQLACPSCGAPVVVPPKVTLVRCDHCRVQARVVRAGPHGTPLRLAARGVASVVVYAVLAAVGLAALTLFGLTVSYVLTKRPSATPPARSVNLGSLPERLEDHEHVLLLDDGRTVVASSSGRFVIVERDGTVTAPRSLTPPGEQARLRGLARAGGGAFHASVGGALVTVGPGGISAPLPAQPERRTLGPLASDEAGVLRALTTTGEVGRVSAEGTVVAPRALGAPLPVELVKSLVACAGALLAPLATGEALYRVHPETGAVTPESLPAAHVRSPSVACAPDGGWLVDANERLLHRTKANVFQPLSVERPYGTYFHALSAHPARGLALLSGTGLLLLYDALPPAER